MGKEKRNRRSLGENGTERAFALAALEAGMDVKRSPSIHCDPPVADKNGNLQKTVTTPDYQVFDSELGVYEFVEITQGSGELPSKAAQRRVAEQAGVPNYIQLTGDQVAQLKSAATPEEKRRLLRNFFSWTDEGLRHRGT